VTDTATRASNPLVAEVDAWVEENWSVDLTVREWWQRLVDAGYCYPAWPSSAGGTGRSWSDARTIATALAAHRVIGPPLGHMAAGLAAPTILAHGTPEQIPELVRPIATGEAAWCQLFSEPGSGSDLASVGTRAIRDGDEWVVSGQKVWNSSADKADMAMLLARTDLDQPKHRGITYFVIDMHQVGVEARPLRVMDGTAPFCEVFLTEARVRGDHVIGALNEGWRVAQTTLASERNMVAGGGVKGLYPAASGQAGDLDLTCGEVVERGRATAARRKSPLRGGAVPAMVMLELASEYGKDGDALIRQELARYWSQVKVNGWTMRRSAMAGGQLTGADGSIAKLSTARICQQSRDLAYRIAGSALLLQGAESPMGGDLQRVNLASPGNRIGGGTDEIQLNVLGEKALGLPREPDASRDLAYRDLKVGTHPS
jgi:alkylation response protein AidB-like acyl-CoA dehydrogenase